MIKCISHKRVYPTQEIAEDALIEARTHFDYVNQQGPVAVYQCEDCGYYHFTSRGPANEKLTQFLESGKISKQKEANHWLEKLKRK